MTYPGDCYFWIERAQSYLNVAKLIRTYNTGNETEINMAAFNVAMAVEATLKYLLCHEDTHFSDTHDHTLLARQCGEASIQIPKAVRVLLSKTKAYESKTRYVVGYTVSPGELDNVYATIRAWCDKLYTDFIDDVYALLKRRLPPSTLASYGGNKELLVTENKRWLESSVTKL